jgi:hypothetical protein
MVETHDRGSCSSRDSWEAKNEEPPLPHPSPIGFPPWENKKPWTVKLKSLW